MSLPMKVKELSRVVADPRYDDPDLVMRQLRHWTNLGLLTPRAGTFTGTGTHRDYDAESARRAAILVRFAALGLSVGVLRTVVIVLDRELNEKTDGEGQDLWRRAIDGSGVVYLGIRFVIVPGAETATEAVLFLVTPAEYSAGTGYPSELPQALPTIWLDLTDLFGGVGRRLPP